MKLNQHRVLVTGGTAGIGKELARVFLERGSRVAICGRDEERLAKASAELGNAPAFRIDLSRASQLTGFAERVNAEMGGLTMLVNNAGIQRNYRILDRDPLDTMSDSASEIQVNLASVVALTSACLPFLRAADEAAVVNVSSGLAFAPKASAPVYCATKAAIRSYTQALRYQMAVDAPNVKVVELMPPLVDTAMTRGRGSGKVTPRRVALETAAGLERDRELILVGKSRVLHALHSVSPRLVMHMMRGA